MKTKVEVGDLTLDIEVQPDGKAQVLFTRSDHDLGLVHLRERGVDAMDLFLVPYVTYHVECNRAKVATIKGGKLT